MYQHKSKILNALSIFYHSVSSFVKSLLLIMVLAGIGGVLVGSYMVLHLMETAPALNPDQIYGLNTTLIFDREGDLIDERGVQTRTWVDFNDISPVMIDAILATEDANFFRHPGVDWRRTLIATFENVATLVGQNDRTLGGSTITQQLINVSHLLDDETGLAVRDGIGAIERKVQEIYLAAQLEQVLSKEQILTAYLNLSPFGGGIYGVQRAAEYYFGVAASDLTLSQAATLAGLVQLPNAWRPDIHADNTERRRDEVLNMMVHHGFISAEMSLLAQADPISDSLVNFVYEADNRHMYQSFIDAVLDEVEERFGLDPHSGLQIFTNMDRRAQAHLYNVQNTNNYVNWPSQHTQTGIAFIETQTGRVRAIGGGRGEVERERDLNRATGIRRQPGSTTKSIIAYAPGMEFLGWGTGTVFIDEEFHWPAGGGRVHNWRAGYSGPVTLREALDWSWNVPAGKAFLHVDRMIGRQSFTDWVTSFGLDIEGLYYDNELTRGGLTPAASIGGVARGWSPLQMAAAYAAFGNGGYYNEPFFIDRIITADGQTILAEDIMESNRIMSAETAWMSTDMLRSVMTSGTGAQWANQGLWNMHLAGKTGTSNLTPQQLNILGFGANNHQAVNDSWFIGFSGQYTAAVWGGYDEFDPEIGFLHVSNQGLSGRIFNQVMRHLNPDGTRQLPRPYTVQRFGIEIPSEEGAVDGQAFLATSNTPSQYRREEYFRIGTQPTEVYEREIEEEDDEDYDDDYDDDSYYDGGGYDYNYNHEPYPTPPADDGGNVYTPPVEDSYDNGGYYYPPYDDWGGYYPYDPPYDGYD